jgi:hypothetical protein
MKKFVKLVDFGNAFMKVTEGHADMRLMSIGTTSDGNYTFRCCDDEGNERVFKVSCWDKNAPALIDRVVILEHAIQYGKDSAVEILKCYGPDNYLQTKDNYNDLLYLLTCGKEGSPMEDF